MNYCFMFIRTGARGTGSRGGVSVQFIREREKGPLEPAAHAVLCSRGDMR